MRKLLTLFLTLFIITGCCSCISGGGTETTGLQTDAEVMSLHITTEAAVTTKEVFTEPDTYEPETTQPETTEVLITEAVTTEAVTTAAPKETISLDKKKVMFVGNSYTYWGKCVSSAYEGKSGDDGYFYQVAKSFGDTVIVTNYAFPNYYLSHSERGAYQKMLANHPNYYNNPGGKSMDSFYNQDYVILQQTGSNQPTTYDDAKKIISLFPPDTVFCYYVTTNEAERNHVSNLEAAKKLHDEDGVIYIPIGHLAYDLWRHAVKIPDTKLNYIRSSFIVARDTSDGFHPNYLTGYLTSLMTYCAITGKSAVGASRSYVSTNMMYYIIDTSNFDKILASDYDMNEIQKLADQYIEKYNK